MFERRRAFYSEFGRARLSRGLLVLMLLGMVHPLGGCAVLQVGLPGFGGDRANAPTAAIPARAAAGPLQPPEQALGADWATAHTTLVNALTAPEPTSASWINPQSGTMGTIATRAAAANGACRGFDLTVFRNETSQRMSGEACPKGKEWRFAGLSAVQPRQ